MQATGNMRVRPHLLPLLLVFFSAAAHAKNRGGGGDLYVVPPLERAPISAEEASRLGRNLRVFVPEPWDETER